MSARNASIPYVAPFATFLLFLAISKLGGEGSSSAIYWAYPIQTVVCGAMIVFFRRYFSWQLNQGLVFSLIAGLLVLGIWVAPQVSGFSGPRTEGFNPDLFRSGTFSYSAILGLRFLRLALVVPIVEELFWRGFLLRYLIATRFDSVPFGTFSWSSFLIVSLLFAAEHAQQDWLPGLLAGGIYNAVAYRTKSLSCCVVAHAITNFGLGIYIVRTRQWGFW